MFLPDESDQVLSLINQFKDVYYLPGNHDHITLEAAHNYPEFNCYNINKYFRVRSGEKNFFLVHGHELEVESKLISMKLSEYNKISDELCRMNDTEGRIASYFHETFHKLFTKGQPQITDFLQTAEQRQGMDAIDRFAKSKAKYPLLGMKLGDILIFGHTHRPYLDSENSVINTGAWVADMLVPKWFEEKYGQDNACSGWYAEPPLPAVTKFIAYCYHDAIDIFPIVTTIFRLVTTMLSAAINFFPIATNLLSTVTTRLPPVFSCYRLLPRKFSRV